jgi:hypothetical protein
MNSFYKFAKNNQLKFRDISVEMLDKYENHECAKDGGIGEKRELRDCIMMLLKGNSR